MHTISCRRIACVACAWIPIVTLNRRVIGTLVCEDASSRRIASTDLAPIRCRAARTRIRHITVARRFVARIHCAVVARCTRDCAQDVIAFTNRRITKIIRAEVLVITQLFNSRARLVDCHATAGWVASVQLTLVRPIAQEPDVSRLAPSGCSVAAVRSAVRVH